MRFILYCFLAFTVAFTYAQQPKNYSSSVIFQNIRKLNILGSVLYVAAHPDDENTRLIAWLGNEKLYRTAYLSMTRGDGGQNLIGNEQGVELGLIRTQELLSARRIDGGEQFFTRAFDFGYSKGPDETFAIWGKEKILSDVVWVIRKFRPDIVITRFPTTGEGGHGHHTASAILAGEAFDAAGDSTRFPEQLKQGVTVWTPKRLLWNTFNFGSANTIRDGQFKINAGGYNPLLGEGYGEIAARSRSQHKSQGFGVSATRGEQYEYFVPVKGGAPEETLFDTVDVSWSRVGKPQFTSLVNQLEKTYSFGHPERSVPQLINLYKLVSGIPESVWKVQKLKEIKQLIVECSGLFMEAYSRSQFLVPGNKITFTVSINDQLGSPAVLNKIKFNGDDFVQDIRLARDLSVNKVFDIRLPASTPISQPYWLKDKMTKGSFTVDDQSLIGQPENDPLFVEITLDFGGIKIPYDVPLRFKSSDPVKGEVYQPVFVIPAVELRSYPDIALSKNKVPVTIMTTVTKNDSTVSVNKIISNYNPDAVGNNGTKDSYFISKTNQAADVGFTAGTDKGKFDRYKVEISYPHIPDIIYFPEASTKLVGVDLKTSGKNAAYIPGAGDKIPEALQQLGYSVKVLAPEDFSKESLKQYDVIVAGVRAYNIHNWLNNVYPALMDYVKSGGVLFVQYNTNNNIGQVKAEIGPYPFNISRTRVTDEDAPVSFTDPQNSLLHYPNVITKDDFKNWIQERSTYHAAGFDKHYQTLFSMHDPGEKADRGSLIYCQYGKGRFVYSGLVFFRELPAGNPGAYRLFANLIAKP